MGKAYDPRTKRGLKPENILLVGRLSINTRLGMDRPCLSISVWCPFCKKNHTHGWTDRKFNGNSISNRGSHCVKKHPAVASGYWIGLDPAWAKENKEVYAALEKLRARWDSKHNPKEVATV
ncbi:hypothetical protein [Singulisphaera sp. PoT]|uniref:hypothetical protein n=1 Tax=Singulisphaera sp. PoT TaxID=3411797 RepID=UPI003BF60A3A